MISFLLDDAQRDLAREEIAEDAVIMHKLFRSCIVNLSRLGQLCCDLALGAFFYYPSREAKTFTGPDLDDGIFFRESSAVPLHPRSLIFVRHSADMLTSRQAPDRLCDIFF